MVLPGLSLLHALSPPRSLAGLLGRTLLYPGAITLLPPTLPSLYVLKVRPAACHVAHAPSSESPCQCPDWRPEPPHNGASAQPARAADGQEEESLGQCRRCDHTCGHLREPI